MTYKFVTFLDNNYHFTMFSRLELTRMLLTMNASIALADKFHKNTGAGVTQVKKKYDVFGQHLSYMYVY